MFDAGDLVLLPFPFFNLTSAKRRPVLMMTAPDAQGAFLACPVTLTRRVGSCSPAFAARSDRRRPATRWLGAHRKSRYFAHRPHRAPLRPRYGGVPFNHRG